MRMATFLLGAINPDSNAETWPFQRFVRQLLGRVHPRRFKLTPRITLNLGLRYEFETGVSDRREPHLLALPRPHSTDSGDAEQRAADPARGDRDPHVPTDVQRRLVLHRQLESKPFNTDKTIFMPRVGIAIRINDKTAFRAGYARYVIPPLIIGNTLSRVSMPYYSARSTVAPVLEGIPQARLSEPFPASNPLVLPKGNSLQQYTNLGDAANWYTPNLRTGVNDRINFSIQRELPGGLHIDVTYFMNLGHDLPYTKPLNMSGPAARLHPQGRTQQYGPESVLPVPHAREVPGPAPQPAHRDASAACSVRIRSTAA